MKNIKSRLFFSFRDEENEIEIDFSFRLEKNQIEIQFFVENIKKSLLFELNI